MSEEVWHILVVDDEPDVQAVTRLALKRRRWRGRRFNLIPAHSAKEAMTLVSSETGPRISVALIDVVMETRDAGLRLCEQIRICCPPTFRIILRTGQAGDAPEERVLAEYDIDFYLAKTQATAFQLYSTIRACLRAAEDIHSQQRKGEAALAEKNAILTRMVTDLRRSRRETADILQNIRQAILTVSPDLRIGREHSRYACTIFGRNDLSGMDLLRLLGGDDAAMNVGLGDWLRSGFQAERSEWSELRERPPWECAYVCPSGQRRTLAISLEPITDDYQVLRMMVIAEDLTEKKLLQAEVEAKEEQIESNLKHLAQIVRLDPELYQAFLEEAELAIGNAASAVVALRQAPDPVLMQRMFEDMHTLKGSARSLDMTSVAEMAHWVEDAFAALKSSGAHLSDELLTDTQQRISQLGQLLQRIKDVGRRVLGSADSRAAVSPVRDRLPIDRERLTRLIGWLEQERGQGAATDLERVIDQVRALPLVSMGRLYGQLPRMIGDLAQALGKSVRDVQLEGEEIELDASVMKAVSDAVMHLARNALAHGIETPAERAARGKPSQGTVAVKSYYTGQHLCVEVMDDGRGIDSDALVAEARRRGILGEDAGNNGDLFEVLSLHGVSTASEITEYSGRGVGMGAVKSVVEEIGGALRVETEKGRMTRFIIEVPLAIASGVSEGRVGC